MSRREFLSKTSAMALAAAGLSPQARAADEGLTPQAVTIGSSLPLSGPLAGAGAGHMAGMKAAVATINAAGGVNGRQLRLAVRDDAYQPARSVENVRAMIEGNSAFALMSCLGTANVAGIAPLLEQAGMPCVGPITGASSLRKPELKQLFFVRASYSDEASRAVQQLTTMGLKDIALVYLDNAFGQEVLSDAEAALSSRGLKSVGTFALALDGANAGDLSTKVKAAKPDAVLMLTAGLASASAMQALRTKAAGLPLVGLSVSVLGWDLSRLGSAAKGLAVTQVFPDAERLKLGMVRSYQAAMRASGSERFDATSLEGWINAQLMIEGLRRAGRDLTRERLRQALTNIKSLDLGDFILGYASSTAPFVASRFIDLSVLGANGKRLG